MSPLLLSGDDLRRRPSTPLSAWQPSSQCSAITSQYFLRFPSAATPRAFIPDHTAGFDYKTPAGKLRKLRAQRDQWQRGSQGAFWDEEGSVPETSCANSLSSAVAWHVMCPSVACIWWLVEPWSAPCRSMGRAYVAPAVRAKQDLDEGSAAVWVF